MVIVHVLTDPRGGGGVHARALAAAASARGDAVSFVAPTPVSGFETATLGRALGSLRAADIVHLHGIRAGILAPIVGGRAVVTTHGLHQLRATQGTWKYRLAREVTAAVLRRCDLVICVSEADHADVRSLGEPIGRRAVLIRNGVAPAELPSEDDRVQARRRLGFDERDNLVLFLGGLRHQKNPRLALEAAMLARRAVPTLALLVAGEGPLRRELEQLRRDGVHFLGQRTDVDELLAASDVLLNTSRWEGLSLAVLEALWRGRPVIAVDTPGNREAVGDAGLVVPSSVSSVRDALARVFNDRGLRASLADRARPRAQRLFDERTMSAETLALYDRLSFGRLR